MLALLTSRLGIGSIVTRNVDANIMSRTSIDGRLVQSMTIFYCYQIMY